MQIRWMAVMAICVAGVSACSNTSQSEVTVGATAATTLKTRVAGLFGRTPDPAPPPVITRDMFAAIADPILKVTIQKNQSVATVVRVAALNGVDTYQGADQTSLMFQDGVIVGTRGIGDDLMQADVSGVLRGFRAGGGTYTRSAAYLDGEDQLETLIFHCSLARIGAKQVTILGRRDRTTQYHETCTGAGQAFENTYWRAASGQMIKSDQWIARNVSPLTLEKIK